MAGMWVRVLGARVWVERRIVNVEPEASGWWDGGGADAGVVGGGIACVVGMYGPAATVVEGPAVAAGCAACVWERKPLWAGVVGGAALGGGPPWWTKVMCVWRRARFRNLRGQWGQGLDGMLLRIEGGRKRY